MTGFKAIDNQSRPGLPCLLVAGIVVAVCGASAACSGQVLTVGPEEIPRQYLNFHPTSVALPNKPLDSATHQALVRLLDAEQGFAVRPIVRGHKGIILQANGAAKPAGADYAKAIRENGASVDAGQRVTITNLAIDKDRIIFELNGGPDHKHRILRHIQIGAGGGMTPLARQEEADPVGSRITLVFDKFVPNVTGEQVEQLLAPVIDFAVKSPAEAYTDTLPPKLKATILAHQVLVGMNRQMVIASLGPPPRKSRERDGDMPFEEWIYGEPPKDVQFVRVNGDRVIRVEIAKVGQTPEIRAENEMGDYWATATDTDVREVRLGDSPGASKEPDKQAPAGPSLRMPGETLPADHKRDPQDAASDDAHDDAHDPGDLTMKPVHFPKPDPEPVTSVPPATPAPAPQPSASPDAAPPSASAATSTGSGPTPAPLTAPPPQ